MKRLVPVALILAMTALACGKKKAPVVRPMPPPATSPTTAPSTPPPAPPAPINEPVGVPGEPVREDAIASASLDDLNKNSPLRPVFFVLDSSDVDAEGQKILDGNAALLKRYPTWAVTIEGHCDERGTAEYNLALGERRAIAARAYLISLGIAADRLRTVSYGEERPKYDNSREETRRLNRRAALTVNLR